MSKEKGKVDYLKSEEDIKKVKHYLKKKPKHLLLFTVGINSSLCINDLLSIKSRHLKREVGDIIIMNKGIIMYTQEVKDAYDHYCIFYDLNDDDYVFSKENSNEPMINPYLNYLVKKWMKDCDIDGNFSSSSLGKTYDYFEKLKVDDLFEDSDQQKEL